MKFGTGQRYVKKMNDSVRIYSNGDNGIQFEVELSRSAVMFQELRSRLQAHFGPSAQIMNDSSVGLIFIDNNPQGAVVIADGLPMILVNWHQNPKLAELLVKIVNSLKPIPANASIDAMVQ